MVKETRSLGMGRKELVIFVLNFDIISDFKWINLKKCRCVLSNYCNNFSSL